MSEHESHPALISERHPDPELAGSVNHASLSFPPLRRVTRMRAKERALARFRESRLSLGEGGRVHAT